MDWKKNDVFQVRIEDMSDTGEGIGKTDGCHQGIDPVVAAVIALGMNPQVEVNLCRRGKSQGPIGHR